MLMLFLEFISSTTFYTCIKYYQKNKLAADFSRGALKSALRVCSTLKKVTKNSVTRRETEQTLCRTWMK